ncbi:NAD(P)-binding protein, partial [Paracoccus sp. (in: a-proteobacteria)]|uniref:NAD(P)-binding protein n=1 Tax=Paracoccus sp. TaxID=267 RepID=UPI0035AE3CD7
MLMNVESAMTNDAANAMVAEPQQTVDELDVVIIGAGISGIGAASYIRRELPGKTVCVLEARDSIGGTWDLFRYPGIRSDSDLHTFGYEFKPWRHEHAIADAPLILDYLRETVGENGLTGLIRLRHRVLGAEWDSATSRWTLTVQATDPATGQVSTRTLRAGWVFAATGYYRYDEGFAPQFQGQDEFEGTIIHPQHWPENFDYA